MAVLDVNLLVALAWPNHVHHQPALAWWLATLDGKIRSLVPRGHNVPEVLSLVLEG
ncbi:MAG TPA: hypothetical protein VFE33_28255 [Thermoanaerobaculia bacterium]|nr:hypothetical protein [Thermoanaerobaculia bacterium]